MIEIITPADRAAWLRARGRDVTASTAAALFDAHPYVSRLELWAQKSGRLPADQEESAAMRRGRLLEPVAVALIREMRPEWRVEYSTEAQVYYRDPEARIGATPDVIVHCPRRGRGIVQIKSVEAGVFRRTWLDDDGNVDPPLHVAIQGTVESSLVGADWAAAAALVVGFGIDLHLAEIDLAHRDGVMAAVRDRTAEFWAMIAEGREPAVDPERDAALIDRLYAVGDPREEIDLTGDPEIPGLIEAARRARDDRVRAEAAQVRYEAEIKAAMGTAELAHVAGGRRITWRTIRKANPGGAPTIYRVLRLPQG